MYDFMMPQYPMSTPEAPVAVPPVMSGTAMPEDMAKKQQQAALVDALRGMSMSKVDPQAAGGRVVSTGPATAGMDATAIGGALGKAFA